MLLDIAIGDAYGAGHEYAPPAVVRAENTLKGYRQHEKHKSILPGHYTDDTQMALAIAELMLAKDPTEWTHADVAGAFVGAFKRDPRTGYSGAFYDVLVKLNGAEDFLSTIRPHSPKSGGAMRAAPLGLLPNTMQVVDLAMMQASLTHATRDGMNAAAGAALLTHYCYHRLGPKTDLPKFLHRWVPGPDWLTFWRGKVGSRGLDSVMAALNAVVSHSSMSQVLRACIAYTGDVDTVAAIAMPAASVCPGMEQNLPQVLVDTLENGTYGRDYLSRLDSDLLLKFPSKAKTAKPKATPPTEPAPTPKAEPEPDSEKGLLSLLFED